MANKHRLFVGISIPGHIRDRLTLLQPRSAADVRPVSPAQMHLTLRFVGDSELRPVADALTDIAGESFILGFDCLGKFGSARRGRGILWIGLELHPLLNDLYEAVSQRLAERGIELDDRPFRPHVTLARCGRETPASVYQEFVQQPFPPLPSFEVTGFILYSSKPGEDGSVYTPEVTYSLESRAGDKTSLLNPGW